MGQLVAQMGQFGTQRAQCSNKMAETDLLGAQMSHFVAHMVQLRAK